MYFVAPKPDANLGTSTVDFAHQCDLFGLFLDVILVDAHYESA